MTLWTINYFVCLIVSVVLAGIIIPNIMNIAFKRKLFDDQNERKIHKGVVPRLGGISFLPAAIFSFCAVIGFNYRFNLPGVHAMLQSAIVPLFFVLCALMLMYLVGIADDLVGVRYRAKFVFQIIAGILIVLSGSWVYDLDGFCGIYKIPTALGWLLTVFVMLYVVNAVNLIDGIDGLASGLSAIALIFYSCLFFFEGEYAYAFLAGATLGTLIPFFYYNVFGKVERHTKIFMGDTGSLTIGAILAFLSIRVFSLPTDIMDSMHSNAFVLAIAPILIPCFDVARVFLHRVRNGRNPFLPDKCHIHHKLLALGCKQWQALLAILFVDALFVALNLALAPIVSPTWLIMGDLVVLSVINLELTRLIRSREKRMEIKLYE